MIKPHLNALAKCEENSHDRPSWCQAKRAAANDEREGDRVGGVVSSDIRPWSVVLATSNGIDLTSS